MKNSVVISRSSIRNLIDSGQLIVILDQKVLRLNGWLKRHPGGLLPILHMVGKDATNQITIYHSAETLKSMSRYQIGVINEPWTDMEPPISAELEVPVDFKVDPQLPLSEKSQVGAMTEKPFSCAKVGDVLEKSEKDGNVVLTREAYVIDAENEDIQRAIREYPSLDPVVQREIDVKFKKLHEKVQEAGLYECFYSHYAWDFLRFAVLFGIFLFTFSQGHILLSSVFLGCFWQQIMFVAHDAGHMGITHNGVADTIIGVLVADLCCGLSLGWWKSSHNVHHLVPNHPKHDPDIQNVPIFATSPTFFSSLRSTYYNSVFPWDAAAAVMIPFQQYSYYPIMALARFNLYMLSWQHIFVSLVLIKNRKVRSTPTSTFWVLYLEVLCMAIYWYWQVNLIISIPTWPLRVAFVIISHSISLLLHIQISLSHFGMSTADLGPTESFAQKQLRTTMDVDCPAWLDWLHGGLQFQAIHHLFPRMPKHNYREAQALVKEFCKETGIKYTIYGFVEGNKVVLGRLGEIAKQVKILMACNEHMMVHGDEHHH